MATVYWFRKVLRIHDNPSLLDAIRGGGVADAGLVSTGAVTASRPASPPSGLLPVYVLEPWYTNPVRVSANRCNFLLGALADLDLQLRRLGSRLFVVRGEAAEVIPRLCRDIGAKRLVFEREVEPYARVRDARVAAAVAALRPAQHVELRTLFGHTLYCPDALLARHGASLRRTVTTLPTSYSAFRVLLAKMPPPPRPYAPPTASEMPPTVVPPFTPSPPGDTAVARASAAPTGAAADESFSVPTLADLGFDSNSVTTSFRGHAGESAALTRLAASLARDGGAWACAFEKPKTSPNSLAPSTTALSPHLAVGCLGARRFYWALLDVYRASGGGKQSQPPVSLEGQLLWREFFWASAATTPNFDRMAGNPVCRPIAWTYDAALVAAWRDGRTGYPVIDACMAQLRADGWLHHLARHAVACFLTRGDLYQSWEVGARVFDELLLDSDYALNCGNWMWLSASAYFHQFFRVYSPVAFGRHTDPDGEYIRRWLPQFATLPKKYVYEPWTAPASIQRAHGVVVGVNYPKRIVDHSDASAANIKRHTEAYARFRDGGAAAAAAAVHDSPAAGAGALQIGSDPAAARAYAAKHGTALGALPGIAGGAAAGARRDGDSAAAAATVAEAARGSAATALATTAAIVILDEDEEESIDVAFVDDLAGAEDATTKPAAATASRKRGRHDVDVKPC